MIDDRHDGFQPLSRVLERVMDRLHDQLSHRDLSKWPEEYRAKLDEADRLREGAR